MPQQAVVLYVVVFPHVVQAAVWIRETNRILQSFLAFFFVSYASLLVVVAARISFLHSQFRMD